jgi:hypothetical protein
MHLFIVLYFGAATDVAASSLHRTRRIVKIGIACIIEFELIYISQMGTVLAGERVST